MKDEIQFLKDFVEGNISSQDFEQQLYTNSALEKLLSDSSINWKGSYLQDTSPFLYLAEQNYKDPAGLLNAQGTIRLFLDKKGVKVTETSKHSDDDNLLLSTSPNYIDADLSFIEKHILPEDKSLSKSEQKQYIKQRYIELFRYQTKPPKWIQNPEWPIQNNSPLFFLGQIEIKRSDLFHDDGTIYLFIDSKTGVIETIKQFY
ncbi:hypothetical protein [Chryseobacterium jejuense]|uniref:Uncharacterized protein n=1 Tax=Chryseobacterium jejuense TaxID=445960 RepID=A0A2X2VR03_CHRJE|nr:hypothetical protein [Chryseobacterium jejuense]SDJ15634.1 hypothetical protein SAMN05421542_2838 [Chryseobacterium jejuense]SQB28071.1 Uncharacterised protein [Chryseobacterium jejuense]